MNENEKYFFFVENGKIYSHFINLLRYEIILLNLGQIEFYLIIWKLML